MPVTFRLELSFDPLSVAMSMGATAGAGENPTKMAVSPLTALNGPG